MIKNAQTSLKESLSRIESVFMPGQLCRKRDEMLRLREAGDTMIFEGEVRWSVILPDHDQKSSGDSESLDTADRSCS